MSESTLGSGESIPSESKGHQKWFGLPKEDVVEGVRMTTSFSLMGLGIGSKFMDNDFLRFYGHDFALPASLYFIIDITNPPGASKN